MITVTSTQNFVHSADGTPIAYSQAGSGAALILVHGTGADSSRWAAVLPELARHFTVLNMDRRGRGRSGDAAGYSIEREYEDIAAVAAAMKGPVDLLGHSFGAACALGAAGMIANLGRLILYEPPMLQEQQSHQRKELIARMDEALARGDREAVVVMLMNEMLGMPMQVIERARGTTAWAASAAAAHTFPRELRRSSAYGNNPATIQALQVPTLLLLGSDSPESFQTTTQKLHAWIPNSRIAVLPGQQHSAMLTAPELFAAEITRFLEA
jgi:pimeloyl-ACP methyl ester carboxylesterase